MQSPLKQAGRDLLHPAGAYAAMRRAYEMAGMTAQDVGVAEIHDCCADVMSGPAPDREGYIDAAPHRVWWEYFGEGDREAVCLLNGLAMDVTAWYGFLERLRPEFDVLLFDYPGQGRSSTLDVPYFIPQFADTLAAILDVNRIERIHAMGISWGGFVGLDFARLHQQRLHTLIISGILLSHEALFSKYQDLSLRFYRSGPVAFEIYTHYMYEKIFGERFLRVIEPKLEKMRTNFHERWKDKVHCLIRLTEAQNPFFAELDANLEGYRHIATPTLLMPGEEDRVIAPRVQRKIAEILPNVHWEPMPDCGHVVYLEQPDRFFGRLKGFARTRGAPVVIN